MGLSPTLTTALNVYANTKEKIYPNGQHKFTVCSKPIFKIDEYMESTDDSEPVSKPKDMGNEVRADSMKRAKEKIFDIAMCNQFDYFITWTLSKEKIDRYDPMEVSKKLKKFLQNIATRKNVRYLVIPEYHADGAIHMHGLISGNLKMVDSGKRTKVEKGSKAASKIIYNMPEWTLGFSTAIPIDGEQEVLSKYMTKYITKDFRKIFGAFYYAGGKGLVRRPEIRVYDSDYQAFDEKEFRPDGVNLWFKYFSAEGK